MWPYPVRKYTLLSFESLLSNMSDEVCPFIFLHIFELKAMRYNQ